MGLGIRDVLSGVSQHSDVLFLPRLAGLGKRLYNLDIPNPLRLNDLVVPVLG